MSSKVDMMGALQEPSSTNQSSRSAALRKGQRSTPSRVATIQTHVMVPHNLEDDICCTDIHRTTPAACPGRVKVDKLEKELSA